MTMVVHQKQQKLIRDGMVDIITRNGGIPRTRTLSNEAFRHELLKKLVEEAIEVRDANGLDELLLELADLEEVRRALFEAFAIDHERFELIRKSRARARGTFTKKLFLMSVKTKP